MEFDVYSNWQPKLSERARRVVVAAAAPQTEETSSDTTYNDEQTGTDQFPQTD